MSSGASDVANAAVSQIADDSMTGSGNTTTNQEAPERRISVTVWRALRGQANQLDRSSPPKAGPMNVNILQVNFTLNVAPEAYTTIATGLGDAFAAVDGLEWKIWLLNPGNSEAGGIYCFRDASAAQAFLAGPLAAQVKAAPFLTDLSVKQFQVMEELTAITRGPVASTVSA
jgi:hypothetical protein